MFKDAGTWIYDLIQTGASMSLYTDNSETKYRFVTMLDQQRQFTVLTKETHKTLGHFNHKHTVQVFLHHIYITVLAYFHS